jgi:hypothetical protein
MILGVWLAVVAIGLVALGAVAVTTVVAPDLTFVAGIGGTFPWTAAAIGATNIQQRVEATGELASTSEPMVALLCTMITAIHVLVALYGASGVLAAVTRIRPGGV